jgi:thioredoxin-like negative regulator of GroEL
MTIFAMFAADEALRVANARIAQLQLEAANEHLAGINRPRRTLTGAVRSALSSLRTALGSIDAAPVLPRLADYPYRS